MPGQPLTRNVAADHVEQHAGLAGGAGADGIAQRNLVAAHGMKLACHCGDLLRGDVAVVGTAQHAGDVATHAHLGGLGRLQQRHETLQAVGDGAVDVLLREGFAGCGEHRHFLHLRLQRGLEALEVGGERRVGDAWPALDAAEHLGGAGHLWHPFGRDEAADFDVAQAGGAQLIDQAHLVGDADRLLLVLQAVARADFDQAHGVGQVHRVSSSVSGCKAWGGHRFSCPPRYRWVPLWWIDAA